MIEIGDKSICVVCSQAITWTGMDWKHDAYEEHPAKPPLAVQVEPKHVVLEVQSMKQNARIVTNG